MTSLVTSDDGDFVSAYQGWFRNSMKHTDRRSSQLPFCIGP